MSFSLFPHPAILHDIMDNIRHDTYRAYWKHQAENHPTLLHQDLDGQRIFQEIDIEEALGDFRGSVREKSYIMRLINYTYFIDRRAHEAHKVFQGGFIIARHYSLREEGSSDYLQALTDCEKIVDDMIEKAIADSRNGHPLFHNSIDSEHDFTVTPVRLPDYAGWRVIYSWRTFFRNCITDETAPAWVDGGATPHDLS